MTAGAAAAEDKVALSVDKTTPGKVPMLEYTVLTDAAGPDAVKPVSAEIFWKENGKDVSTKTETVGGDGFVGGKCTVIDKYARTPSFEVLSLRQGPRRADRFLSTRWGPVRRAFRP